ncbi:MAG: hypothetical protein KAH01_03770 [Caldisericia bacterium]|nr:hypothetical protein [Caldisericia bacterium]
MKFKTIKIALSLVIILSIFMVTFPSNSFSYLYPPTEDLAKPVELDYEQVDLKVISSFYSSGMGECLTKPWTTFSSFQHGNNICSFMHYYHSEENKWVDELFRYDCENEEKLPTIKLNDFIGFDKNIMKIDGDTLVTYGMLEQKGSWLVWYSLKTGKVLWLEPANVICRVGDNFLAKERESSGVVFSLLSGVDGSEIWSYSFSDYLTTFCGVDENNCGFFKHDKSFLSQIDLENGTFISKLIIWKDCFVFVKGNYILLQYGLNIYECLQIDTKKSLWKKQFEDCDQYFIYVNNEGLNEYYWKGIMISEVEVLTYNDDEIVIFNLKTGKKVKSYFIPEYSIVDFKRVDEDGNYFFQIQSKDEDSYCYSMFKTDLQNESSSTLFEYTKEFDNYTKFNSCYSICGKDYCHHELTYTPKTYIGAPD